MNSGEACRVPVDDAARFRLEIMFSSGAQHNPYQFRPVKSHTMSISPRECLHKGRPHPWLNLACSFSVSSRCPDDNSPPCTAFLWKVHACLPGMPQNSACSGSCIQHLHAHHLQGCAVGVDAQGMCCSLQMNSQS